MAIQVTDTLTYNYGTYNEPYFRLTLHLPVAGTQTPVDCFMYASQEAYASGSGQIACMPFYIESADAPTTNDGNNVINKYLYFITEKVVDALEASYPDSTFEIVEIPLD